MRSLVVMLALLLPAVVHAQGAQSPAPRPLPPPPSGPLAPPPTDVPPPPLLPARPPPAAPTPPPAAPSTPAPPPSPTPAPPRSPAAPPAAAPSVPTPLPGPALPAPLPSTVPPNAPLSLPPAGLSCPAGSSWSTEKNGCVAQVICPPPALWKDGVCVAEPTCPPQARQVGGRCFGHLGCPAGSTLSDGVCLAPVTCPPGTAWGADRKCVPPPGEKPDCRASIAAHDEARDRDTRWARGPALQLSLGPGFGFSLFNRLSASTTGQATRSSPNWYGPAFFGALHVPVGTMVLGGIYNAYGGSHDGVDYSTRLLVAELARQCACVGSNFTWRVGTRVGYDFGVDAVAVGSSSQSIWRLWQGLYVGFDIATLLMLKFDQEADAAGKETTRLGIGPALSGSLFIGYSIH